MHSVRLEACYRRPYPNKINEAEIVTAANQTKYVFASAGPASIAVHVTAPQPNSTYSVTCYSVFCWFRSRNQIYIYCLTRLDFIYITKN